MTTEALPAPVAPPTEEPFPYGWRYVQHDADDGSFSYVQVPLTLDDVLHPEEGDQVTQSTDHQRRCRYLCNVFTARLATDPAAVALHEVRISWDVADLKAHGPDLSVILGIRERRNWSTFNVATEGVRPALIVEVTSPGTRGLDLFQKVDEYDIAGVPLYVIVDFVERQSAPQARLIGYQQLGGVYTTLAADAQGRLWLPPVRLWLGLDDGEVFCYDESGTRLGDYSDVVAELAATEAELAAEVQARQQAEDRATAAEARLRALEAETARLRGER